MIPFSDPGFSKIPPQSPPAWGLWAGEGSLLEKKEVLEAVVPESGFWGRDEFMFYPTGPQSPAFGVILYSEGFRDQTFPESEGESWTPSPNAAAVKVRGRKGGRLATFGKSERPFGGIFLYTCVCVFSIYWTCWFWGPLSILGEVKKRYEKAKVQFFFFLHSGLIFS